VFAVVGGRGSGGSQIRDVGIGLAVGVLMDTFVVRTVLVPCTVVLLGKWNWWPSTISMVPQGPAPAPGTVAASAEALGITEASADSEPSDPGARDTPPPDRTR